MFKNYLLVTLRNFRKQPGFTALNILGLTLGIAAVLLILLYLFRELSYDQYHAKKDRIFRVSSSITEPDDAFKWAVTQMPLAPTLKKDYPEVESSVRFIPSGRTLFEYNNKEIFEEKCYIVDSTLFDIFSFEFIWGSPETALVEPNSLVISESLADKIFGDENPLDKTLQVDNDRRLQVKGVIKDMPDNSHIIANAMTATSTFPGMRNNNNWGGFNIYSYILLKEGTSPENFEAKLDTVVSNYVATIFDQFNIKVKYALLPLTSIHLQSDFEGEPEPTGQMSFIYIFGAVAFFMLLLAAINYMNLATARAIRRSMEVGVRKVIGADRRQLITQFLMESLLLTLIATLLSFVIVLLTVPVVNNLFGIQLRAIQLFTPQILLGILGILVLVGILGGSYPAFFLSAFRPIAVLQGTLAHGKGSQFLRKSLVVLQFVISIFMIIGTGIIYDQMNYLRNKDLGFDKEQMLTFGFTDRSQYEKWPVIKNSLENLSNVKAVATASTTPSQGYGKLLWNLEGANGVMEQKGVDNYRVDFNFFPTLGMEIIAGRNFSAQNGTDSTQAVMVNESMVKRMNWEDPIGKRIQFGTNDTLPFARVIGVVKDFHQQALYEPISPLLFRPGFSNRIIHVKIINNVPQAINEIEKIWLAAFPDTPFEYSFVDESFMELYEADQVRARIFTMFSIIMIVIACLGLLGLASYTADQRTKEIGVRRIIGASQMDIFRLLTQNFLFLVAIAALPAFLIAWYFMRKWLNTFAYHGGINFWLFGLALLFALIITLATTSYHAIRAVGGNPSDSLRYE